MTSLKQTSFSGGELSPQVLSRSDQAKYASGLRLCSNALIQRFGSAQNRAGTQYLDTETLVDNSIAWNNTVYYTSGNIVSRSGVKYICIADNIANGPPNATYWALAPTTSEFRIVKFVFNYDNSYELIFSVNNIRIYKNGVQVAAALSQIPAWDIAVQYQIGNMVTYTGSVWMCHYTSITTAPGVAPDNWKIVPANTAGLYPIDIPMNFAVNVAESAIALPAASLGVLQAVNLNDIMTVTSQYFRPFQLTRFSDVSWTMTQFSVAAALNPPNPVVAVAGVGAAPTAGAPVLSTAVGGNVALPAVDYQYVITSYNAAGESLPSNALNPSVGGADGANPVTLTWTAASGTPLGYFVYVKIGSAGFGLIAVVNGLTYMDAAANAEAYPAKTPPVAATGSTVFEYVVTSVSAADGSESLASNVASCTGGTPTSTAPNVISWPAVTGAGSYNVYRIINGIPGIIGTTTLISLNDTNIQPDFSQQPPVFLTNPDGSSLFTTAGNWPATCCFFQQRLCFANTLNEPTSVWMSRTGSFSNFSVSTPIQDTDAIQFVVAGTASQPIIGLMDLQKFIIFTASAEYACTGNQAGTITPKAVNLILQGTSGARLPTPLTLGNTAIFVQARGTQVRDLRFEIGSYTYTGKDLTIFSTQMFNGLTVVDMDWEKIKDSIVWCVMSNGALYGMTYVAEQQVWAWHEHSFINGFVEHVCVVPNAADDVVYLIVRRTINGQTVRYFEALAQRDLVDTTLLTDFTGPDCSLTYNGTATDGSTLTPTTGGGWTTSDLLTLTASTSHFAASDVTNHNQVVLSLTDATTGLVVDRVTFSILTYLSATQVQGYALRDVPTWAQVAVSNWGKAVTTFTGMNQLAGQSLSILGDGNVIASPLNVDSNGNPGYPAIVVANDGSFVIPKAALVVCAGLPVQMDIQTMPLENAQGETIANKHVAVKECCPIFYGSRGGLYGQDFQHLNEWKQQRAVNAGTFNWGQPIAPYTGPVRIPIRGSPEITGQVCIRVVDPLPFAMSGIVVSCTVGNG